MERHEEQLIALISKNPQEGITMLIDQYGGAVNSICKHIMNSCDQTLVEDAVQECFLHIWRSLSGNKKVKKSLKAYIYQVARNCAYDTLEKYQKQRTYSTDQMIYEGIEEIVSQCSENLEDQVSRANDYRIVHTVVNEMTEPDRTIFLLRYFYNYTVNEIAEQLNLKDSNVESRLRRKKILLQNRLKERGVTYDTK